MRPFDVEWRLVVKVYGVYILGIHQIVWEIDDAMKIEARSMSNEEDGTP